MRGREGGSVAGGGGEPGKFLFSAKRAFAKKRKTDAGS